MDPVEIADKKEDEKHLLHPEDGSSIQYDHLAELPPPEIVDLEGQPDAIVPQNDPLDQVQQIQLFVPERPSEFYKNVWFARWMFLGSLALVVPQIMIIITINDNYCEAIQSRVTSAFLSMMILMQITGAIFSLRQENGNYNFVFAFAVLYYITIFVNEITSARIVYPHHCGDIERIFMAFYWLSILLPIVVYFVCRCIYVRYRVRERNAPVDAQPPGIHLRDMVYTYPFCEHNKQGQIQEGEKVNETHEKCEICLAEYALGERVLELPCNHMYHCNCITPHFDRSNECPTCKRVYQFN